MDKEHLKTMLEILRIAENWELSFDSQGESMVTLSGTKETAEEALERFEEEDAEEEVLSKEESLKKELEQKEEAIKDELEALMAIFEDFFGSGGNE